MKNKITPNVVLNYTNNVSYRNLQGVSGELSLSDGNCKFEYIKDGQIESISFPMRGRLGELDNPKSKEITVLTTNANYTFDQIPLELRREVSIGQPTQPIQDNQLNPQIITQKEYSDLLTDFQTIRKHFEKNRQDEGAYRVYGEAKFKFDNINHNISNESAIIIPDLNTYVANYLNQTTLEQGQIGERFEFKRVPCSDVYALYTLDENGQHGQEMAAVYDLRDQSFTFDYGRQRLEETLDMAQGPDTRDNVSIDTDNISL